MSKWNEILNFGIRYSLHSTHFLIRSWSFVQSVLEFCTFQREMFTGGHIWTAFIPLMHWDLLFCMKDFEVYLYVTAALYSHVTQPDRFRKDFCISNTPDSKVHFDGRLLATGRQWEGMTVKIEFFPVLKAKLVLDSKPRISPLELSYFLLLVRLRSTSRNDLWASKLFQMIRFLEAQRMPRAICLWEIRSENFLKSNSSSAADPII